MTPILNAAQGSQEDLYTKRQIQSRNCIERCFGLLKARWRCLLRHRTLHYHPKVASKIVLACCVLHNITINAQIPLPNYMAEQQEDGDELFDAQADPTDELSTNQNELVRGRAMLNTLISRM